MLTAGIILILIGSLIRGWGLLNHSRSITEKPDLFRSSDFVILVIVLQMIFAIIGAILIGLSEGLWIGLLVFILFWFLSRVWIPLIKAIGF